MNAIENSARVFFSSQTLLDTRDAGRFGEKVMLLEKEYSIHKANEVIKIYRDKLNELDYDPETDFIAITGHTVFVCLLALVASDYGDPKYLLYDQITRDYEPKQYVRAEWAE